jgi:hypothetical protein
MSVERDKTINHFKKYSIEELCLQYFVLENKVEKVKEKRLAFEDKITKMYNVKSCIYFLIKQKQELIEAEKMIVDSETETESDSDESINISDIQLLDTYEDEEIDDLNKND